MASPTHTDLSLSLMEKTPQHRAHLLWLPATASRVRAARLEVRELLTAWRIPDETAEDAVLVLSELVTNVIAHTPSSEAGCLLRAWPGALRVEVTDQVPGPTAPRCVTPRWDGSGGRGLLLVGELSRAWGVRECPYGTGRTVWAELAMAREPAPTAGARSAAYFRPPHGGDRRERRES